MQPTVKSGDMCRPLVSWMAMHHQRFNEVLYISTCQHITDYPGCFRSPGFPRPRGYSVSSQPPSWDISQYRAVTASQPSPTYQRRNIYTYIITRNHPHKQPSSAHGSDGGRDWINEQRPQQALISPITPTHPPRPLGKLLLITGAIACACSCILVAVAVAAVVGGLIFAIGVVVGSLSPRPTPR